MIMYTDNCILIAGYNLHILVFHPRPYNSSKNLPPHTSNDHSRTSINIFALSSELLSHPDHHFVDTLIGNLITGCD